jgi:hypothetical protein
MQRIVRLRFFLIIEFMTIDLKKNVFKCSAFDEKTKTGSAPLMSTSLCLMPFLFAFCVFGQA